MSLYGTSAKNAVLVEALTMFILGMDPWMYYSVNVHVLRSRMGVGCSASI
jgi:hypothetical protein